MPAFEITLPDGRSLDIDAPNAKAAADGAAQWAKANPAPKPPSKGLFGPLRDEVSSAKNALVEDFKTAYGDLGSAMKEGRGNPGGERAAAADRIGGDVVNFLTSPITGAYKSAYMPLSRATGIDPFYFDALGMGATMALGMKAGTPRAATPKPTPETRLLSQRGKVNPAEARAKANTLRQAGIEPSLADVTGDPTRRLVRAAGAKSPEAGEALSKNALARSADTKPAIMDRTRRLTGDPRTAEQAVGDLRNARRTAANEQYREPYAQTVDIPDEVRMALADEPGRAALRRARSAAVAQQRTEQVAEIDALLAGQTNRVSAGTLDRVRIAMSGRAEKLSMSPDTRDIGVGIGQRAQAVDSALERVPGLDQARADYRAKSSAIDVLEGKRGGRMDPFSTDPADYGRWLESLPPEARDANKLAIRQEILDTLGGQRASTMGSIDEITTSQYARRNLEQALGPEAGPYLDNLAARVDQLRNAQFMDPKAGSRTAVLETDTKALDGIARGLEIGQAGLRGDIRVVVTKAADWLRSRGISDRDAVALAEAATDPARLEAVLSALERQAGPEVARGFRQIATPAATQGYVLSQPAPGAAGQ